MRIVLILFYLMLIIFGVSFAALNAAPVHINLYFTDLAMPVSVLVACVFSIGIILGLLIFMFKYWRLKMELHKTKNHLKLLEKEVSNLRAIPLQNKL